MATDWTTRKRQMRDRPPRTCEVPGCRLPAARIGSRCAAHDAKVKNGGHHTAARVTILELRPWVEIAANFIAKQEAAGHPGILAAVEFLERLIRAVVEPEGKAHRFTSPTERAAFVLAHWRRDALDVRRIIAVGVAVELHSLQFPKRWPDALFSDVQFGHAVASYTRSRQRSGASIGRTNDATRKTPALTKEMARQLRQPLLPLYVKAAAHLHQTIERAAQPIERAALNTPFHSSGTAANEATS